MKFRSKTHGVPQDEAYNDWFPLLLSLNVGYNIV